ncbi:MAG: hypothetical protein HN704_01210 [Bacteroidetes bacterium]|nr:hypothetical protein [Bacteroidota bacterium]MBT6688162.1 hypothetical protein [Bacteroidota bacterium]MBT7141713.1 hypothetical protein [Bacteroidota bacterium]MBT7490203.1 hypothetical protein [Bacteroidota bacterium]
MKNQKIKLFSSLVLISFMFISMSIYAQSGQKSNKGKCSKDISKIIPDISEKQEAQIEELKTPHMKKMLSIRNKMKENQVKLEILETADVADMNELYKCIEEIGKVNVELMKLMANQKQDIRKILTEDQRIIFDLHEDHQKQGKQKRQSREGKSKGKSKGKRN